jgi:hypothetical protein
LRAPFGKGGFVTLRGDVGEPSAGTGLIAALSSKAVHQTEDDFFLLSWSQDREIMGYCSDASPLSRLAARQLHIRARRVITCPTWPVYPVSELSMNSPRTTAEDRLWLRVIELESRDQPSLLGLSLDPPVVSTIVAPIVSALYAAAPSATMATAITSSSAALPTASVSPTTGSFADITALTARVSPSASDRVASGTTIIGDANVSVGAPPATGAGRPAAESAPVTTGAVLTSLPIAVKVSAPGGSDTVTGEGGAATVTHGGGIPIHTGSPDVPATSTSGTGGATITSSPNPQPAPTPQPDAPAAGVGATAGGGKTSFVLTVRTPAIAAGAPTGGTGIAVPAAGAVPAGTAIGPIATAVPPASVAGANTGVVLVAPTEHGDDGTTGGPEAVVEKASLPTLAARWDGYLMGVFGAAYGFWHWRKRPAANTSRAASAYTGTGR